MAMKMTSIARRSMSSLAMNGWSYVPLTYAASATSRTPVPNHTAAAGPAIATANANRSTSTNWPSRASCAVPAAQDERDVVLVDDVERAGLGAEEEPAGARPRPGRGPSHAGAEPARGPAAVVDLDAARAGDRNGVRCAALCLGRH